MRPGNSCSIWAAVLAAALLTGCDRGGKSDTAAESVPPAASAATEALPGTPAEPTPVPAPDAPQPVPAPAGTAAAETGPATAASPTPGPKTVPAPAPTPAPAPAPKAEPAPLHPDIRRMTGRWVRPDGGYVLNVRSIAADGRVDAEYLNPRSIRIARAEARHDGNQARLFVEFSDENYHGSTYTLAYSGQTDQLYGVYFQAMLQESYDVMFVREPGNP